MAGGAKDKGSDGRARGFGSVNNTSSLTCAKLSRKRGYIVRRHRHRENTRKENKNECQTDNKKENNNPHQEKKIKIKMRMKNVNTAQRTQEENTDNIILKKLGYESVEKEKRTREQKT